MLLFGLSIDVSSLTMQDGPRWVCGEVVVNPLLFIYHFPDFMFGHLMPYYVRKQIRSEQSLIFDVLVKA